MFSLINLGSDYLLFLKKIHYYFYLDCDNMEEKYKKIEKK